MSDCSQKWMEVEKAESRVARLARAEAGAEKELAKAALRARAARSIKARCDADPDKGMTMEDVAEVAAAVAGKSIKVDISVAVDAAMQAWRKRKADEVDARAKRTQEDEEEKRAEYHEARKRRRVAADELDQLESDTCVAEFNKERELMPVLAAHNEKRDAILKEMGLEARLGCAEKTLSRADAAAARRTARGGEGGSGGGSGSGSGSIGGEGDRAIASTRFTKLADELCMILHASGHGSTSRSIQLWIDATLDDLPRAETSDRIKNGMRELTQLWASTPALRELQQDLAFVDPDVLTQLMCDAFAPHEDAVLDEDAFEKLHKMVLEQEDDEDDDESDDDGSDLEFDDEEEAEDFRRELEAERRKKAAARAKRDAEMEAIKLEFARRGTCADVLNLVERGISDAGAEWVVNALEDPAVGDSRSDTVLEVAFTVAARVLYSSACDREKAVQGRWWDLRPLLEGEEECESDTLMENYLPVLKELLRAKAVRDIPNLPFLETVMRLCEQRMNSST